MDSHDIYVRNKLKQVVGFISKNSKVLDIGCEDAKIKDFLINCEYYAIDVDKKQIDNLKKQGVKAKQVDLNKDNIPFTNQKFDYILLLDILEHIIDPRKLLLESKKRLKNNGKLIISLPNDYHILNKIRFFFNKHLTSDPFAPYGHLHYFPIRSGKTLIIKQGLRILGRYYVTPTKPSTIPHTIKKFLAETFPQSFARDVLYLVSLNDS